MHSKKVGFDQIRSRREFADNFDVSRETMENFDLYEKQLRHWQTAQNLVAKASLDEIWSRHFADCAQLLEIAPENARIWVDLGSGAGFPGMVIAILAKQLQDRKVHLIEANARKCAFLQEIRRLTRASVEIHNQRITSFADSDSVFGADVICARALAPMEKLLGYAQPFFEAHTTGLFLKGKGADKEIQTAKKSWRFEFRKYHSRIDYSGCIVEVKNLRSV